MGTNGDGFFPTTIWSRVLAAGVEAGRASPGASPGTAPPGRITPGPALDQIARAYWRPVAAWLRAGLVRDAHEAADLAQDFFVWMLDSGFLGRADRTRGRFRAFLKTALRNFAVDRARKLGSKKRGGDRTTVSLSDDGAALLEPAAREGTPDDQLDRAWRAELVERAMTRLEGELAADGKAAHFAVFRDYYLAPAEGEDYRSLAQRHGLTTSNVSNHLMLAKRRFRALLREEVVDTVDSQDELRSELHWLFGAEGGS